MFFGWDHSQVSYFIGTSSVGNDPGIQVDSSGNTRLGKDTGGTGVGLWVGNNAGDVGVGTTTPAVKLHISEPATTGTAPLELLRLAVNDEGVDLETGMECGLLRRNY